MVLYRRRKEKRNETSQEEEDEEEEEGNDMEETMTTAIVPALSAASGDGTSSDSESTDTSSIAAPIGSALASYRSATLCSREQENRAPIRIVMTGHELWDSMATEIRNRLAPMDEDALREAYREFRLAWTDTTATEEPLDAARSELFRHILSEEKLRCVERAGRVPN